MTPWVSTRALGKVIISCDSYIMMQTLWWIIRQIGPARNGLPCRFVASRNDFKPGRHDISTMRKRWRRMAASRINECGKPFKKLYPIVAHLLRQFGLCFVCQTNLAPCSVPIE